jgi:hypothetical protein
MLAPDLSRPRSLFAMKTFPLIHGFHSSFPPMYLAAALFDPPPGRSLISGVLVRDHDASGVPRLAWPGSAE